MKPPKKPGSAPDADRILELEDRLKTAERALADMKRERDEAVALVNEQAELLEVDQAQIDQWIDACGMEMNESGVYEFPGDAVFIERDWLQINYNRVVNKLNRAMAKLNAASLNQQSPGRPLAATEAQRKTVHDLRWLHGLSLRQIADETSLSLRTVRTIIDRELRTDRTTIKRLEKLDPEKADMIRAKARQRSREALPKSISDSLLKIDELRKAAKGLGGSR